MTTPVATPIPSEEIKVEAPAPARSRSKRIGTFVTVGIAIAITIARVTHDGSKDAMKDFAKDLKDEPGISTVKTIKVPGYTGAVDVNSGSALVRFKRSGNDVILSYEVRNAPDAELVDTAIEHAAKESGFKNKS
jgi:hypothetical protein